MNSASNHGTPNPMAMSEKQLAELLTKTGGRTISPEAIAKDVRDGAPTNGDGSLNLIHYAAWLAATDTDN